MSNQYVNVTAIAKSTIYFDGKVISHKIILDDGSEKTLGVMLTGEYTFDTAVAELMEVTGGEMAVLLPEQSEWQVYKAGESYPVPANASFKVKVTDTCDYVCSYL
jgi:uncharacterized protein YaiE (UPF0345 family)